MTFDIIDKGIKEQLPAEQQAEERQMEIDWTPSDELEHKTASKRKGKEKKTTQHHD
jgi:hypothetical protein